MSITVNYKGADIAQSTGDALTLLTAGKYMEADVLLSASGGGGGLFGILNEMQAYGTCSVRADIIERGKLLYISVPADSYIIAFYRDAQPSPSSRPVYFGTLTGQGKATSAAVISYCTEFIGVKGTVEGGNTYYKTATAYGVSNGQAVAKIGIPSQPVSVPSDGYDLTFMLFRRAVQTDGVYPALDARMQNMGNIPPDTWVDVDETGKIYFGFTEPTLD